MANTFAVSRNHLVFGLCLPLAVLLGYLLAEPLDNSSLAVVVMVVSVLFVPLMMRWHHALLILSWNALIVPYFVKGQPYLWMIMAFVSLLFGILGRSVSAEKKFLYVPSLVKPMGCFLLVVFVTAAFTGGIGMRALGSENFGGKNYFYILAAITGYFALSSQAIPRNRAMLFAGMFFLPSLTALVSNVAYYFPSIWFLYDLFPSNFALDQANADWAVGPTMVRITGLIWASYGVEGYLLALYGVRGIFDPSKPWRLALFAIVFLASLFAGFRSTTIQFLLTFGVLFFIEGLWKTRFAFAVAAVSAVGAMLVIGFANKLPLSAQRALSFLPLDLDPMVKHSALASTEWRVEMWKNLLPEIPSHLFAGKGYSLNARELEMFQSGSFRDGAADGAMFAGDYHNGPLSLIFPFALYGLAAFAWIALAGVRFLYRNYKYGDPQLRRINGALLAMFLAKAVFFFGVFGAIATDLPFFTGILGLSVALNHGEATPTASDSREEWDLESA